MKFVESVEVGEAGAGLKGEGAGLEGQGAGPRPIPFHFFFVSVKGTATRFCDSDRFNLSSTFFFISFDPQFISLV